MKPNPTIDDLYVRGVKDEQWLPCTKLSEGYLDKLRRDGYDAHEYVRVTVTHILSGDTGAFVAV